MSSFEMAMIQQQQGGRGRGPNSDTGSATQRLLPNSNDVSLAPSIANSSMRKSVHKRFLFVYDYLLQYFDSFLI